MTLGLLVAYGLLASSTLGEGFYWATLGRSMVFGIMVFFSLAVCFRMVRAGLFIRSDYLVARGFVRTKRFAVISIQSVEEIPTRKFPVLAVRIDDDVHKLPSTISGRPFQTHRAAEALRKVLKAS